MASVTWINPVDGGVVGLPFTVILQVSPDLAGRQVDVEEPATGALLGSVISDPVTGIAVLEVTSWVGIAARAAAVSASSAVTGGSATAKAGASIIAAQSSRASATVTASAGVTASAATSTRTAAAADPTTSTAAAQASATAATSTATQASATISVGVKTASASSAAGTQSATIRAGVKASAATSSTATHAANPTTAAASDTGLPVVQTFTLGTPTGLVVPISAFSATDGLAPTLYLLTESATPPSAGSGNWQPASHWAGTGYTFGSAGAKTLWAWAKDGAGTVSSVYTSRSVTVSAGEANVYAQGPFAGELWVNKTGATGYQLSLQADDGEAGGDSWSLYRSGVSIYGVLETTGRYAGMRLEHDGGTGAVRVRASETSATGPWTTIYTYTDPSPLSGGSSSSTYGTTGTY